jgi:hypothetical protein
MKSSSGLTPCSDVVGNQRFGGPYSLHVQGEIEDGSRMASKVEDGVITKNNVAWNMTCNLQFLLRICA